MARRPVPNDTPGAARRRGRRVAQSFDAWSRTPAPQMREVLVVEGTSAVVVRIALDIFVRIASGEVVIVPTEGGCDDCA
jgi:hypothetical protein